MCFCWFLRLCFDLPGAESIQQSFAQGNDDFLCPILNRAFLDLSIRMNKYEHDIKTKLQKSSSEWIRATNVNQLNPLWILWGIGMSWLPKRGRFASSSFELGCKQLQQCACFKEWSFSGGFRLPKKHRGRMSSMYLQFLFHLRLQAESSGGSGAQFGCLCIKAWVRRKWCRYTRMIQLNPNPRGMRDAYRLFINIGQVPVRRTGHNAGKDF